MNENYETNAPQPTGEGQTLERDPRGANAQRHGILSEHVPLSERAGYAQHAQSVRDSTGASTYLEQRLSDRAALALWRLERVARYEAARVNNARRAVLGQIEEGERYGPAQHVTAAYDALKKLMPWESAQTLRERPEHVEDEAQGIEREAAYLLTVAEGGSAEGCSVDEAHALGAALVELLGVTRVPYGQMVRAMMNRPARRGEADSVQDGEWNYEPGEVPGLLAFYRERLGEDALRGYAQRHRLKAEQVRAAQREALSAQADALDMAALGGEKELEKVARYEAHLERVLYRALHDLEAARREGQGQDSPPPLRGVLDELNPGK